MTKNYRYPPNHNRPSPPSIGTEAATNVSADGADVVTHACKTCPSRSEKPFVGGNGRNVGGNPARDAPPRQCRCGRHHQGDDRQPPRSWIRKEIDKSEAGQLPGRLVEVLSAILRGRDRAPSPVGLTPF